jgi:hypothetical protein
MPSFFIMANINLLPYNKEYLKRLFAKEHVARSDKGNQTIFGILEVFLCRACS